MGIEVSDALTEAAEVVAEVAAEVTAVMTECNVCGNRIDTESARALAKVATEKRIMLFGIKHDQKEANFNNHGLGPVDAILIASDLMVSAEVTAEWQRQRRWRRMRRRRPLIGEDEDPRCKASY